VRLQLIKLLSTTLLIVSRAYSRSMLLFYEDEPSSTEAVQPSLKTTNNGSTPTIDPLPQYGSYAFIPSLSAVALGGGSADSLITDCTPTTSLKVLSPSSWTYCGPLLQASTTTLPPSFHTWAALTLSSPATLISKLLPLLSWLQTFLSEANIHNYWLTIRCTAPTHEYDTPRWHTDENFFAYDSEAPGLGFAQTSTQRYWKLCTTFLGPSTLFLKRNETALKVLRETKQSEKEKMGNHTCTSIRCVGCSSYADSVRESLAHSLQDVELETPALGEVAFFRIGQQEGAVHSEPRCDTDRIFINVIPGTQEDLRDLMAKWGIGFPRAWCFGSPVGFVKSDEAETLGMGS
jgi:hypothetical protein